MPGKIFRAMVVTNTAEKTYERPIAERWIDDLPEGGRADEGDLFLVEP